MGIWPKGAKRIQAAQSGRYCHSHLNYQGQGLFKKLTLETDRILNEEGIELIIPNLRIASVFPDTLKWAGKPWVNCPLKLHFQFHIKAKISNPYQSESLESNRPVIFELEQQSDRE